MKFKNKLKNELKKNNQTNLTFEDIVQKTEFNHNAYVKYKKNNTFGRGFAFGAIVVAVISIGMMIYITNVKNYATEHAFFDADVENQELKSQLEEEKKALQQRNAFNKIFSEELQSMNSNFKPEVDEGNEDNKDQLPTPNEPSFSNDYIFFNGLTYDEMRHRIVNEDYVDFKVVYQLKLSETEFIYFYLDQQVISNETNYILELKSFIEDNDYEVCVSINNVDKMYELQNQEIEKICNGVSFDSSNACSFTIVVYQDKVKTFEETITFRK